MKNKSLKDAGRRKFLKGSAAAIAGIAASGLTLAPARKARAGTQVFNVSLTAERFGVDPMVPEDFLIDSVMLPRWRFNDPATTGLGLLKADLFRFADMRVIEEGDEVNITLTNDLPMAQGGRPINIEIPGVTVTGPASVDPGGDPGVYSFEAPAAGSYIFQDGLNGELGRAMGLMGPMVVTAPGMPGSLFNGGPAFDRQYTLMLHELDDRLNMMIDDNQVVDFDSYNYEPNYFFINGVSAPDTMKNPMVNADTLISMTVGELVAVRYINAGLIYSPMHPHGYHAKVISRDRILETTVVDKDVIFVSPGECVDVTILCNQAGKFPMHTHNVPATQANGVYPQPFGGALTMIDAAMPT
jgi:FtsP/CotA-like multicopper oxidase with cupredoxin domain